MATERVTTREDGAPERVVERETYVDRGGGFGVGGVIIGIAVLALVAIVGFFLLNANQNDAIRTNAVTSAASSVADSANSAARDASNAANSVGRAADDTASDAAQSVNPPAPSAPSNAPAQPPQ